MQVSKIKSLQFVEMKELLDDSPSDHLFSASGHILSPLRATLSPDKVNMPTILSKNFKTLRTVNLIQSEIICY